jgi:hypothetical protein
MSPMQVMAAAQKDVTSSRLRELHTRVRSSCARASSRSLGTSSARLAVAAVPVAKLVAIDPFAQLDTEGIPDHHDTARPPDTRQPPPASNCLAGAALAIMERIGIEPMTSCLQSRRSPN